jgi:hypothetical protein
MRTLNGSGRLLMVIGCIGTAVACGAKNSDSPADALGNVKQAIAPGSYILQSRLDGQCVQVDGGSRANGADVVPGPCATGDPNQLWGFNPKARGDFRIQSDNSTKCIVAVGKPPEAGDNVQQGRCLWKRSRWYGDDQGPQGPLDVRLRSTKSVDLNQGAPLCAANNGFSIVQADCGMTDPAQWFRALPPDVGPCCEPSSVPGCLDPHPAIVDCVCGQVPSCCTNAWDAACVTAVDSLGCGHCLPGCPDDVLSGQLPLQVTGSTEGASASDWHTPSCGSGTPGSGDYTGAFTAPAGGWYQFDTIGSLYDTTLVLLNGACGAEELACDDDGMGTQSLLIQPLLEGETVIIVVDGYNGAEGSFTLNVSSLNIPYEWTCSLDYYGAGDGCDCGCGAVDADCPNATSDVCDYCCEGSCASVTGCTCDIEVLDPANNAVCLPAGAGLNG